MHIPDGFLSAPVAVACAALSAGAVGAASVRTRALLGSRAVAMMGVTAAFVFAAQMLNFPVAGGTSGHLIGGVLAAVLLGPSAAVIVLTSVLVMQCLVFGDGGLLALGANILNMGVIQPLVGFAIYRVIVFRVVSDSAPRDAHRITAAAFAAWAATVIAAIACAGELALSGIVAPAVVFVAMTTVHLAIGLGEAIITALVVATVLRLRPDLLARGRSPGGAASGVALGLAASLGLAIFVSPFACSWPDGLERVVEHLGVAPVHMKLALPAPLRGYAVPGVAGSVVTTALAAVAGTLLVFGLCCVIGRILTLRRTNDDAASAVAPSRS